MKSPVRVLYVHHASCLGGAEQSLVDMISSMDRGAILPALLLPGDGPLAEALFRIGVDVYFGSIARLTRTCNPLTLLCHCGALIRGVREVSNAASAHGASVIHANSINAGFYAGPAARLTGTKSILHVRDMIPLGMMGKILFGIFDHIVPISEAVAEFYGLENSEPVPSGVDFSRFDKASSGLPVRASASIPENRPVIGMAGQLVPWKNHGDFLRAASRVIASFPEARFLVAGSDLFGDNPYYRAELEELVDNLGIKDNVEFSGWKDDMAEFYAALDVLIHPVLHEPFGRVVVEAMGCGVPVVAYDSAGPSKTVRDGKTGYLVHGGNWKALAEKTNMILKDEKLRSQLSSAAKKRARSRFSSGLTAHRIMQLYNIK